MAERAGFEPALRLLVLAYWGGVLQGVCFENRQIQTIINNNFIDVLTKM